MRRKIIRFTIIGLLIVLAGAGLLVGGYFFWLLLFIVDGRQPNYSEGVTLPELAQIAIEYGADTAFSLDGGGSSTLVIEDRQGQPQVLNSPIHASIPGVERPVGNHLGAWVKGN